MTLTQIKPAGLSKPVDLADNEKIRLGTGNDLEIYHSGTHSFIENGTGTFYIRAKTGENSIVAYPDGSVKIAYDDNTRLETTSAGVTVTGAIEPTGSIKLGDDRFVYFGAGVSTDLYIGHEPSSSRHLFRSGDGATKMVFQGGSETMMVLQPQGAVELYYDNGKQLETRSNGIALDNNLFMIDSKPIYMGNGLDLSFYHDGTHSYIDNATGHLYIRNHFTNSEGIYATVKEAKEFGVFKFGTSEWLFRAAAGGSFEAWYDGSKKLETTSYGARVYGNLENHDDYIKVHDAGKLVAGNSDDLKIYHSGSHSYLQNSTGNFYITAKSDEDGIVIRPDGAVELYEDNTLRLATTSNGARVYGHLGVNRDPAGTHPLWVQGSNQYVIGLTNTSASSTNFPWLLHKSINSTQAFGIHFNGLSGDPFHCDKDGGIFLGKETATANRLDDYEIGEYEPTLRGGSNSGTEYSLHGGANTLSYVKVGEMVTLFGRILITAHNNASGTPHLSLPFNSFGGTEQSGLGQFGIYWHGWNVPNDGVGTSSLEFTGNNNYAVMIYQRDNASWAGLNDLRDNMGSLYVAIQGSYRCNT